MRKVFDFQSTKHEHGHDGKGYGGPVLPGVFQIQDVMPNGFADQAAFLSCEGFLWLNEKWLAYPNPNLWTYVEVCCGVSTRIFANTFSLRTTQAIVVSDFVNYYKT